MSIEDLIDYRMVCGAGGGFVSVITKNGDKQEIHHKLKEVFLDFNVDVWDTTFI